MDDVVQRLRAGLDAGAIDLADIMDAADEIERLRQFETAAAVTEPMPAVVSGSGSVTPVPYAKHDEKRVDWHAVGARLTDAEREALSWFTGGRGPVCSQHLATIRNLMARLS